MQPKLRYSLAAALLTVALTPLSAQSVTTEPVGAMTTTLGVGITPLGISLVNPDTLVTTVSSVNGPTLNVAASNVGEALTAGEPYYLEVYSGDLKGDRFDVDVAATITNGNGTVVLQGSSTENTFDVGSLGSLLDGSSVRIRKHVTIEQVHQSVNGGFVGNNSPILADQIHLFDTASSGYVSYFLRGDSITWRQIGTTPSANKVPIHPGKGIFVFKKVEAVGITTIGSVRTNDFVLKFGSGLQLLSPPWPSDLSPSDLHASSSNGWFGSNSASVADQIHIFNTDVGAYESFFLRGDGQTWRKIGTTTEVTNNKFIAASNSFFIRRASADAGFLYVNDLNLN